MKPAKSKRLVNLPPKWVSRTLMYIANVREMNFNCMFLSCWKPKSPCGTIKTELNGNRVFVLMVLPSRGAQVSHDVHGLHGTIHHMTALHKLLCGLPVDDLWFGDTTIAAKQARPCHPIIVITHYKYCLSGLISIDSNYMHFENLQT